jgi:hypothetical protein
MKLKFLLVGVVLLVVLGGVTYYFVQYQYQQNLLLNPNKAAVEDTKKTLAMVSKFMVLPKEQPTIATVVDKRQLSNQPFFKDAENGDKVLIYLKEKEAIIYRPSTNKIIQVGPININQPQAQAQNQPQELGASTAPTSPTPTPKALTVALYNGSPIGGLTAQSEAVLLQAIPNMQVVAKQNAARNNYTKTVVVDVSGTRATDAKAIAQLLKGSVEQLPAGEFKPTADILVIVGQAAPTQAATQSATPIPTVAQNEGGR